MWTLFLIFLGLGFGYAGWRGFIYWLSVIRNFPKLRGSGYRLTSLPTGRYNCIAWAAGDTDHWWDPSQDGYWPQGANKGRKIADLISAYQAKGFALCQNGNHVQGREKIVLYEDVNGDWTHAAKRLDANKWSSKLGKNYDISHKDPDDLGGNVYGQPTTYMIK